MTAQSPVYVNRNIPGYVAALVQGRGHDAYALALIAASESEGPILLHDLYAYLLGGFVDLSTANGANLTVGGIAEYFSALAEATIMAGDL